MIGWLAEEGREGGGGGRGGRKKKKNSKPGERAIEFSGRETLCGIPDDLDF